jgi:hypothetical protein
MPDPAFSLAILGTIFQLIDTFNELIEEIRTRVQDSYNDNWERDSEETLKIRSELAVDLRANLQPSLHDGIIPDTTCMTLSIECHEICEALYTRLQSINEPRHATALRTPKKHSDAAVNALSRRISSLVSKNEEAVQYIR